MLFVAKISPILICYNFPNCASFFFSFWLKNWKFFFFLKSCYSNAWQVKKDKTLMEKAIVWATGQIFREKWDFSDQTSEVKIYLFYTARGRKVLAEENEAFGEKIFQRCGFQLVAVWNEGWFVPQVLTGGSWGGPRLEVLPAPQVPGFSGRIVDIGARHHPNTACFTPNIV